MKKALSTLFLTIIGICLFAPAALAQAGGAADNEHTVMGFLALGAGIGLGIAAAGGGMGQGRAAASALEGIARNPGAYDKVFTPLILSLALIESLVIYSLVISFLLYGKISIGG